MPELLHEDEFSTAFWEKQKAKCACCNFNAGNVGESSGMTSLTPFLFLYRQFAYEETHF